MLESELVLENCDGGGITVAGDKEGAGGEEGDRNSAGNRWPREETLALLKVRSDMDVAFRDSSLKGPLWDEVSRKLGELGYHRSAKKCKEKFENIYKYHKRTKEGRSGRPNGKNYRFFEQLEVFDTQFSLPSPHSNKINPDLSTETETTTAATTTKELMIKPTYHDAITTPSTTHNPSFELMCTSTSTTSSSGGNNVKRKRKLEGYFERLMKEVLEKQEDLQNKFIGAIEKCELDRVAREEAWRTHELARVKKEQEILAQERAIAAAKDAAVIAFLQRVSDQAIPVQLPNNPINPSEFGNGENSIQASSSRWPKAEVEALIRLRTNLDLQYQDNGAKGPLWEEISSAMKKLGYNRNSRRCKEKWENINKYYKRVKESNKKRPEDSKTCPYFNLLESIYERKSKKVDNSDSSGGCNLKPEDILMQMIGQQQQSLIRHGESENIDQNQDDDGDDDEDEDDNEDNYQVVANNPSSLTNME